MVNVVNTPLGTWDPLYIVFTAILIVLFGLFYFMFGGYSPKSDGEGAKPFLSGEDVEEYAKYARMEGEHALWGLRSGFGKFFDLIKEWHSGVLTDYALWYMMTAAIMAVIIVLSFLR